MGRQKASTEKTMYKTSTTTDKCPGTFFWKHTDDDSKNFHKRATAGQYGATLQELEESLVEYEKKTVPSFWKKNCVYYENFGTEIPIAQVPAQLGIWMSHLMHADVEEPQPGQEEVNVTRILFNYLRVMKRFVAYIKVHELFDDKLTENRPVR